MASELKLDNKLQSEIDTLKSMFEENEITINRKDNMVVIDYITSILKNNKKKKIKLIFAFNINKIASSIIITVKRTSKNKNPLNSEITDLITSNLMNKVKQEIENMPIYQCINYFNNEIKQNQSLFMSKKSKTKQTNNKSIVNEEKKNEEKKSDHEEKEYIAFIRFNHLLHGKQHKKENEMLSEIKNLKHCSNKFFGYYFFGKPGIICICSTINVIKTYVKTCNNIGKKSCISYNIDIKQKQLKVNIVKNSIKTIFSDRNEKLNVNELNKLLNSLQIKDTKNVLSVILTGNETDFEQDKNDLNDVKERQIYFQGYKYDFRIEIKTINGPYGISNGNLYMSIYGENENKLVDKYKFEIKNRDIKRNKKTNNIEFNFEFNDIWFLNQIGNLNKLYVEHESKDSWTCEWIKIYVYQMFMGKGKKNKKNKPILKREYQAKMRKSVTRNTPRYANLSYQY